MQEIRDKAQGVVAWVIVAMIAFVFCFWGVSSYFGGGSSNVFAVVGNREITLEEVDAIYNRTLRLAAQQKEFDISQLNPAHIKQQIALSMARQAALIASLKAAGLVMSDEMLVENIRTNNNLQEDGKFSMRLYKEYLARMGVNEAEFEATMRDELLLNMVNLSIVESSFITKGETERIIALKNQKRDFGYAVVSAAKFLPSLKIDEAGIAEYYAKHKEQYVTPDKVQLEYLELSIDDLMQQVPVTEAKLQEYYQANQQAFSEPEIIQVRHIMINTPKGDDQTSIEQAHKKIDAIYEELQHGANFAGVAKQVSDDKQSADSGGDLGWVNKNDALPPEVFALPNGAYTKPIELDYGWHIFQRVASKGGGVKDYAAVKSAVLQRYKHDAAERLFSAKGEELANLAFENPTSLAVASDKLQLPIKTTEYFTKHGGLGIAQSNNVVHAAFSDDVFNASHNSELVRVSDDIYVVIRVKDKQPSHQQTLAEVHATIEKHLALLAASEKAKAVGDGMLTLMKEGVAPNKVAAEQKFTWRAQSKVERDSTSTPQMILQRVFTMPKPTTAFGTLGFGLPNGDYVVIALTKVADGIVENSADSNLLETVGKQVANMQGKLEFASLQDALITQAHIKYITK